MIDKIKLLNLTPKKHPVMHITLLLITSILIYLSCCVQTYDIYNATGLINCEESCYISITVPYSKIDIMTDNILIKYQNKEYKINNIVFEEPYITNNIPYQDIKLYIDLKSSNKIMNFKILYNKQRIINKIINVIKERE